MKQPVFHEEWPESWRVSFTYDLEEVFGESVVLGYSYAYKNRRDRALDLVGSAASPPATILDLAAAQGNFSLTLAESGYRVTWNDLRQELADYVRLKHETGEICFAPGNVFELGLKEHFDIVLFTEIIEHVAHPDDFLRKIWDLVKPGGHAIMTTPNGGYFLNQLPKFSECEDPEQFESVQFKPNSDGHIFLLHEAELPALCASAGFSLKRVEIYTNPLTAGHLKTEALLRIMNKSAVDRIERLTQMFPSILRRRIHTNMAVLLHKPV